MQDQSVNLQKSIYKADEPYDSLDYLWKNHIQFIMFLIRNNCNSIAPRLSMIGSTPGIDKNKLEKMK